MKAVLDAFNQEKALVGAFSVIVKSSWTFRYPSFQALMEMVSESVEMTVELHSVISYHLPGDVYI